MNISNEPDENERLKLGHLKNDLTFVTRILRAHILDRNAGLFDDHQIASGVVALLNLIGLNPGLTQKDISRLVVLKKPALTKAVNGMERDGLITRRKEGSDKRLTRLYLTEKGEEKLVHMKPDMARLQAKHVAVLSPAERAMLFEYLWRLVDSYGGIEVAVDNFEP